jgi:hypothetical protein
LPGQKRRPLRAGAMHRHRRTSRLRAVSDRLQGWQRRPRCAARVAARSGAATRRSRDRAIRDVKITSSCSRAMTTLSPRPRSRCAIRVMRLIQTPTPESHCWARTVRFIREGMPKARPLIQAYWPSSQLWQP